MRAIRYLISYDISNDKHRTKVAKILSESGERIQYSVFLCDMPKKEIYPLLLRLEKQIDETVDSIFVLKIDKDQKPLCMGTPLNQEFQDKRKWIY